MQRNEQIIHGKSDRDVSATIFYPKLTQQLILSQSECDYILVIAVSDVSINDDKTTKASDWTKYEIGMPKSGGSNKYIFCWD